MTTKNSVRHNTLTEQALVITVLMLLSLYPKQAWYENQICFVVVIFALFLKDEYSK